MSFKFNFLINTGFGGIGTFESSSFEHINGMLALTIRATTNMTYYFIPALKKNKPSNVSNIASMAANFPFPNKAVYAASKTYIKNFSLALREELKPSGISVSLLQPGATPTNAKVKSQINEGGVFFKISVNEVDYVAKKAIVGTCS